MKERRARMQARRGQEEEVIAYIYRLRCAGGCSFVSPPSLDINVNSSFDSIYITHTCHVTHTHIQTYICPTWRAHDGFTIFRMRYVFGCFLVSFFQYINRWFWMVRGEDSALEVRGAKANSETVALARNVTQNVWRVLLVVLNRLYNCCRHTARSDCQQDDRGAWGMCGWCGNSGSKRQRPTKMTTRCQLFPLSIHNWLLSLDERQWAPVDTDHAYVSHLRRVLPRIPRTV